MHTRKVLRIKLIFAVLLPVAFNAVSLFFADIIYQLTAFFVCALLFLVPFYATVFYIRQYRPSSLKGYFVSDILYLLFPAVVSSVVSELLSTLFTEDSPALGFASLALCGIFAAVMLFGWLMYAVAFRRRRDDR